MTFKNWIRKLLGKQDPPPQQAYDPYGRLNVTVEGERCYVALDEPIEDRATVPLLTLNKQQLFRTQRVFQDAYVQMLNNEHTRPLLEQEAPPDIETDPGMLRIQQRKSWRSVTTDRDLSQKLDRIRESET